jgi:hypothetical protein
MFGKAMPPNDICAVNVFINFKLQKIMKKELNKANTKLALGKMTVAKLRLSQQQMQLINGGEATKPVRPTVHNNSLVNDENNPCSTIPLTQSGLFG